MLVRKLAATASIGLGVVMLSLSGPTIASAAVDAVSVPAAAVVLDDDDDDPIVLPTTPTDPPSSPEPSETTSTPPIPTLEPTTPAPTTPEPTVPPIVPPIVPPVVPTPAPTTPRPTFNPSDPITSPGGGGRGVADEDEGTTDPGADESDEQGENVADDPALGDPETPEQGAVLPDSAVLPQDAAAPQAGAVLPDTGADQNLTWMALLGVGLTVFGGVLLKRPHLARHRA